MSECDGSCKPKCRLCRNAQDRRYHKGNPHVSWASSYRARCRQFGLEPVIESFTLADVLALYGNGCVYCPDGAFEELDHFKPVCHGGAHALANVRPSCARCNAAKSWRDGCPGDRRAAR